MKYLEKYAFEFIPNIAELLDFPKEPTDENILFLLEICIQIIYLGWEPMAGDQLRGQKPLG